MKWCKNGVVGIKIEIKGLKKPLITLVSAIEKLKVYKYFCMTFKVTTPFAYTATEKQLTKNEKNSCIIEKVDV